MTSAGGALGDPTAMVMPLSSLARRCLCGVSLEAWATPKSERTPPTAGVSERQRWAPEVSSRHPTGDCKGEILAPPAALPLPLKPWRPRRPSAREHRRRSVRGPVSSKRLGMQGAADIAGTDECACCGPEAPRGHNATGGCVGETAATASFVPEVGPDSENALPPCLSGSSCQILTSRWPRLRTRFERRTLPHAGRHRDLVDLVGGDVQVPRQIFVMGKRTDFGPFFEKNKILPELQTNDIGI